MGCILLPYGIGNEKDAQVGKRGQGFLRRWQPVLCGHPAPWDSCTMGEKRDINITLLVLSFFITSIFTGTHFLKNCYYEIQLIKAEPAARWE